MEELLTAARCSADLQSTVLPTHPPAALPAEHAPHRTFAAAEARRRGTPQKHTAEQSRTTTTTTHLLLSPMIMPQ